MQYVTYEDLFSFALVIIGIVTIFVAILAYNKEITAPRTKVAVYF